MILIIDDDIAVRMSLEILLGGAGFDTKTAEGRDDALNFIGLEKPELILMDMNFSNETSGSDGLELLQSIKQTDPQIPIILMSGWGSVELAVEGMKLGAVDFINKPWKNDHFVQSVKTALSLYGVHNKKAQKPRGRKKLDKEFNFESIIGEDPKMLEVLDTIARVSKTDASVLILGESGTGKELVAEAIHRNSNRNEAPFVKVNLGGISQSLFESEMFGHVKGAFTDAKDNRIGRFEMAEQGTLFLDELANIPLAQQAKLLRVLEEGKFEAVGSSRSQDADVRIISATNADLPAAIGDNQFRQDLYYRLNTIEVRVPSLSERLEDIVPLAEYFLAKFSLKYHRQCPGLSDKAKTKLQQYDWPGNIRELSHLMERVLFTCKTEQIKAENLMLADGRNEDDSLDNPVLTLDEIEKKALVKRLKIHRGNATETAKSLGLSRSGYYRRLAKYELD